MEGQGDLVNELIMGRSAVTVWVMRVINLLTNFPLTLQEGICRNRGLSCPSCREYLEKARYEGLGAKNPSGPWGFIRVIKGL